MKRRKLTEKQIDDIEKWLNSCDEMLEAMIETAGWDRENRRALGSILVKKTYRLLVEREEVTLH